MKERNEREDVKELLKRRAEVAGRRPRFVRPESWRYKRLKPNWRKPTGVDNKVRLSQKGWPALARTGYRGPVAARGLHPSGLRERLVHNTAELQGLDPSAFAVRMGRTVGARKRREIVAKAKELRLKVLNPRRLNKA
ncbi:MAG: 50S ribosomal protein L32e [Nitrososphaerota archaeon]|nr:50S ribosomal protein L32e [Nitrososphaerota archaeon]MDG6939512.1 50S ribosomal protein L32e [Nitrososphaerota archaeon]